MRPASRDLVVACVREFYDRHGRLPFKQEWEHADGERPTRRTIERRWGWEELLAEAIDIEPDEVEDAFKSEDRYVAMKRALWQARQGLGRWPGALEWDRSGRRPSPDVRQVVRELGSGGRGGQSGRRLTGWSRRSRPICRGQPFPALVRPRALRPPDG
jgi:hypothetical protein